MLRRFFKLIAGSLLTLMGIAIVIEAIRFNVPETVSRRDGWDPISEFLLCVGVVVGGYGAYLAYSGWDPEAAEKFMKENSPAPSPLAGEGGGEGENVHPQGAQLPEEHSGPHPSPLPEYRAREPEQQTSPPDIGVQP